MSGRLYEFFVVDTKARWTAAGFSIAAGSVCGFTASLWFGDLVGAVVTVIASLSTFSIMLYGYCTRP